MVFGWGCKADRSLFGTSSCIHGWGLKSAAKNLNIRTYLQIAIRNKLTWLVLGGDPVSLRASTNTFQIDPLRMEAGFNF